MPGVEKTAPRGDKKPYNESALAEAQKDDANPDADEDVAAEDKVPAVDVTLKETKRILLDLVGLSIPNTAIAVHN